MQNITRPFTRRSIGSVMARLICAAFLFGGRLLSPAARAENVGSYPYPQIDATAKFHENQQLNGFLHATVDAPTASSLWAGHTPIEPSKADGWRLVRCSNSGQPLDAAGKPVVPGGQPALVVTPDDVEPGVDQVHLILQGAETRFSSGDYFLTLARVRPTATDPHPFIALKFDSIKDQITFENTDRPGYSFNVNPVYQQGLDSGTKRNVLHIPLGGVIPALFPGQNLGRFFLQSDNVLSTEYNDSSTRLGAAFGFERTVSNLGDTTRFINLGSNLHYLGNQSLRNQAVGAAINLGTPLGPFTRYNLAPYLLLTPLQYERRFRINPDQSPQHTKRDLFDPEAQLSITRYIGSVPRDATPYNTDNLTLSLTGWIFPNERASGGYSVRRTEGRVDMTYHHAVRWGLIQALSVNYSDGANDANGFTRSTTYGVGLTAFSRDFKLYQH